MDTVSKSQINHILRLMMEDPMIGGATTNLTGAAYAQNAQDVYQDLGQSELEGFRDSDQPIQELPVNETYTDKEVKMAKRFIHLLGGRERARKLLDKVISADEMIGVRDDGANDRRSIETIASLIPSEVDYPTDYSPSFNPSR